MLSNSFIYIRLVTVFVGVVLFQGCTQVENTHTDKLIPVEWSSGFTLPDLMEASAHHLKTKDDIGELLKSKWYAEISVKHTQVGEAVFSSCIDYFEKSDVDTRTLNDNEMSAYLEFKIMCEAAHIIINAKASEVSYLPEQVLTDKAPGYWPKSMALVTSTQESKRIARDPELTFWNDVTPILKHELKSKTASTYYYQGGSQEVEVVGRGDSNGDGVEDIFLVFRDQVEGGDYFNMRLFLLSMDAQGQWHLLKQI